MFCDESECLKKLKMTVVNRGTVTPYQQIILSVSWLILNVQCCVKMSDMVCDIYVRNILNDHLFEHRIMLIDVNFS